MASTISHDGFARTELVRETSYSGARKGCTNCDGSSKARHLFRYGTRRDDSLSGVVNWHKGVFCSIGCFRTCHGEG